MSKDQDYQHELEALQATLVGFQRAAIKSGEAGKVIFEIA